MATVSVVISALNEAGRLPASLIRIADFRARHPEVELELVVVDDGSMDDTWRLIQASPVVDRRLRVTPNRGKGHGLREGTRLARHDLVYLCDADLSSPIEELLAFLAHRRGHDLVIGSRALAASQVRTTLRRKLLGRVGHRLIRLFLGLEVWDTQCGFKLLDRRAKELFLQTTIDRWGFDFELLHLAARRGLRVKELPVRWVNDPDSRVRPLDYVRTFRELISVWWRHRADARVLPQRDLS